MSMSVDGLVSGMNTTAIISGLLQAEAAPQTALKSQLSNTQKAASAYRTVNTTFLAVSAAADGVLKPESWVSVKASSSSPNVTVAAGVGASPGSITFRVTQLAKAHSVVQHNSGWTSTTSPAGFSSLDVYAADGVTTKGTITVGGSQTLADAAAAINASSYDLSAAVVQESAGKFALQVTSKKTGDANRFSLGSAGIFDPNVRGQDATIAVGSITPYTVSSDSNTFSAVVPGTTFTVNKDDPATDVTLSVAANPDAIATKVQALVDAVNAAANTVRTYTSSAPGSTAPLKGEFRITSLGNSLLNAVSSAVGSGGSPARVGFTLSKDGKTVQFDSAKFLSALKDNPDLAKQMFAGTAATTAANGTVTPAVTGIAGKLSAVATAASDSTKGSIVALANGQDALGKDLQTRIDSWDRRLALRKQMLTHQFSAMETALSSLKNQSSWLAGQISKL
jgi:flagellar hook-associated protein 2